MIDLSLIYHDSNSYDEPFCITLALFGSELPLGALHCSQETFASTAAWHANNDRKDTDNQLQSLGILHPIAASTKVL
jgi:hypothetical protein